MKDANKNTYLEEMITKRILNSSLEERKDVISLLLLLFYNNNTFSINYASIRLLVSEIFAETDFIESLQSLIFITDKEENEKY